MNAINLADGLDGLAAGLALFTVLLLTVVGLQNGNTAAVFLSATVAAATFGFLLHNFNPASIYLGDSGSMLLGFWVAALGICCSRKTTAAVSLLIPMIALGVPILDTSLAIVRRWVRRLPISAGDRQHIHHILLRLGLSHRNAVLVVYAVCVILASIALITTYADDRAVVVLLVVLLAVAITFAAVFGDVSPSHVLRRIAEDLRNRTHSDEARIAVNQAVTRLQAPCDDQLLWTICSDCFPALRLHHVQLTLGPDSPNSPSASFQWRAPSHTGEPQHACALLPNTWATNLQVRQGDRVIGEFIALQHLGNGSPLPETAELLCRLRDAIQANRDTLCTGSGSVHSTTATVAWSCDKAKSIPQAGPEHSQPSSGS
jgi:UDP-GlcNAc:undecaprenyl-phosphate GlcNAc-1-phosphate transferase